MKILISVGTTNFDELITILMQTEFKDALKNLGVTFICLQNGNSKMNVSSFKSHFKLLVIKSYQEYLDSLQDCVFGIAHCGKLIFLNPISIEIYIFRSWNSFRLFYCPKAPNRCGE